MGIVNKWMKSSSPMVKVLMAMSITSGLFVIHKLYYAPYAKRKRHSLAEEWANVIIEQEDAMDKSTENQ